MWDNSVMARYFGNPKAHRPGGESEGHTGGVDHKYIDVVAIGNKSETYPNHYESATIDATYYPEKYEMVPSHDWDGGTGTLFTHHPTTLSVGHAFAHPNLRHTIPIMFSHIHQHLGGQFEPDEMLSQDSVDLYHKAKKLGLPVRTPDWAENDDEISATFYHDDEVNDDAMFSEIPDTERTWSKELSQSDISEAKQHYRNLRKESRNTKVKPLKPNLGPQFKQLQLDV